tara:strand:- start:1980 stop:2522 length:543 start_codon:yes stop_codon:yes gene_type:complete
MAATDSYRTIAIFGFLDQVILNQRLALLLLLVGTHAIGDDVSNAKQDAEKLMNSALPFAEKMLNEHGDFLPYGEAMRPSGEIVSVGADSGEEHAPSQELIDILKSAFKSATGEGEYIATAIVYDSLTIPPGSEVKTDAVAVALDHHDDYSVIVFFPYELVDGSAEFQPPFAVKGAGDIFE